MCGDKEAALRLLSHYTAYVERTHLPSRHFNCRLTRKTLACFKALAMHRAAAMWEGIVYDLVRPLKTLRLEVADDSPRRWLPRTPAMAAGLTNPIWTVQELLTTIPRLPQHLTGRLPDFYARLLSEI